MTNFEDIIAPGTESLSYGKFVAIAANADNGTNIASNEGSDGKRIYLDYGGTKLTLSSSFCIDDAKRLISPTQKDKNFLGKVRIQKTIAGNYFASYSNLKDTGISVKQVADRLSKLGLLA